MKIQRTWYALLAALFLLLACTFLSQKISQEMNILVLAKKSTGGKFSDDIKVPKTALFPDGNIYELLDGTGWKTGEKIVAVFSGIWQEEKGMLVLQGAKNRTIITSASRTPQVGEAAMVIEKSTIGEDDYLITYPEHVPELPDTLPGEIIQQSESAILLHMGQTAQPFMEHSAAEKLSELRAPGWRIFSMNDRQRLTASIPLVLLLIPVLLLPLLGCICGCAFTALQTRRLFALMAALCFAALAATWLLLARIDLPASMMPEDTIFNFRHFTEMLREGSFR